MEPEGDGELRCLRMRRGKTKMKIHFPKIRSYVNNYLMSVMLSRDGQVLFLSCLLVL